MLEINFQREKIRNRYAAFRFDFFFWPSEGSCRIQLNFHCPKLFKLFCVYALVPKTDL